MRLSDVFSYEFTHSISRRANYLFCKTPCKVGGFFAPALFTSCRIQFAVVDDFMRLGQIRFAQPEISLYVGGENSHAPKNTQMKRSAEDMSQLEVRLEKIRHEQKLKRPAKKPRKRRLDIFANDLSTLRKEGATCEQMRQFLQEKKNVTVCLHTVFRFQKLREQK